MYSLGKGSSSEIAEAMGLTCSNCSKVIVAVKKKNLIHSNLDSEYKRQMYCSLTEEGRQTLETLKKCEIDLPEKNDILIQNIVPNTV